MSLPGTPAVDDDDDDALFWKGESVHNYFVFWWLIFCDGPQTQILPPHQRTFQRCLPDPLHPEIQRMVRRVTLSPSNDAHMFIWCQLHALRLNPPPPKIVVAFQHGSHHQLLRIPPVPLKGCIAFSI
jgi:hypothetical protein